MRVWRVRVWEPGDYEQVLNSWDLRVQGNAVWRVAAAHDQPNQELTGMEPEGESEFGSRVEGTARTPKFGN